MRNKQSQKRSVGQMDVPQYIDTPEKYRGQATFAVRVAGDSLEPIYSDGDFLLVEATRRLIHGDLGVFSVSREWVVRRYYDKDGVRKLVSLNVDIPDEPISHRVRCKGRVLGKA